MNWSITTIIPLLASLLYVALFVVIAFFTPLNRPRRIFVVYLLSMVVWSLSAFMTVSGLVEVLVWFRIMTAAPLVMMVAIFYFIQSLFAHRHRWAPLVIWYTAIAIGFVLFSNVIIHTAYLNENFELIYEFSPLVVLVAGPGYGLMIFSLIELLQGVRETDNPMQKNRLRYLSLGLSITIGASAVNFTPLGQYPIDIAANGITALIITYTILRHQLLEIRMLIRLGILYSITTTLFGAFYYFIIYLSIGFFRMYSGRNIFWISVAIAMLTAIVMTPLRNRVQIWIDRVFYRERYSASQMLQRLSETAASLLDLTEIAELILNEVTGTLHIQTGAIYVKQKTDHEFRLFAEHNLGEKAPTTLREDHPVFHWFSHQNQILTRHQLTTLTVFRSLWYSEQQDMENLDADLIIPLQAKGKLVGVLFAGKKRSTQPYSQEDQLTLITLSNQMAVAIENARLYEELEATFKETVVALANAIDLRDTYTSDHSQQIADLAAETARELNLPEEDVEAVYWGGLLHDIGKIGIPDSILQKPAKLNQEEWNIIRQHPKIGADLVAQIKKLEHIAPLIEYSHERHNGSGYPYGLTGDEIPIGARIIAVVDSYSAMIDKRVYKPSLTDEEAIEELVKNSEILFDPVVLEAFLTCHRRI
ncbi:HD domain-containing protein [bacterium]|nr:HD domain-containing protein [bacterium]